MTRKRRLRLVRIGDGVAAEVVRELGKRLADSLDLRVTVRKKAFARGESSAENRDASGDDGIGDPGEAEHHSSNEIVDALADYFRDEDGWVLGITAHDLAADGRPCVFGEATLGGRWAVISAARFGARDAASPRLLDRLYREAVHELGHLVGLRHCTSGKPCVMRIAPTVSAIDSGSSEFCPLCKGEFLQKTG